MTPTAQIEVIGSRATIKITAIVDTGFDGHVCVPTGLAVQLGLELIGEEDVELADGTETKQLTFAGAARFFDETHEVQIMLTDSEDALIGTGLLDQYPVSITFPGGNVKVRKRPKNAGRKRKSG